MRRRGRTRDCAPHHAERATLELRAATHDRAQLAACPGLPLASAALARALPIAHASREAAAQEAARTAAGTAPSPIPRTLRRTNLWSRARALALSGRATRAVPAGIPDRTARAGVGARRPLAAACTAPFEATPTWPSTSTGHAAPSQAVRILRTAGNCFTQEAAPATHAVVRATSRNLCSPLRSTRDEKERRGPAGSCWWKRKEISEE